MPISDTRLFDHRFFQIGEGFLGPFHFQQGQTDIKVYSGTLYILANQFLKRFQGFLILFSLDLQFTYLDQGRNVFGIEFQSCNQFLFRLIDQISFQVGPSQFVMDASFMGGTACGFLKEPGSRDTGPGGREFIGLGTSISCAEGRGECSRDHLQ